MTIESDTSNLEDKVREINRSLASMPGPLVEQVRMQMSLVRIVSYLRAAEKQPGRISEELLAWNAETSIENILGPNQELALCEAHFYFICWDSIYKAAENARENSYNFRSFRHAMGRFRGELNHYRTARHHLEHLPERWPGKPKTDWQGDSNRVHGTVAGVMRDLFFVFQSDRWDVSRDSLRILQEFVVTLIANLKIEVEEKYAAFVTGQWEGPAS